MSGTIKFTVSHLYDKSLRLKPKFIKQKLFDARSNIMEDLLMSKSSFQSSFEKQMIPHTIEQNATKFGLTDATTHDKSNLEEQVNTVSTIEVKDAQSFLIFNKILILDDKI